MPCRMCVNQNPDVWWWGRAGSGMDGRVDLPGGVSQAQACSRCAPSPPSSRYAAGPQRTAVIVWPCLGSLSLIVRPSKQTQQPVAPTVLLSPCCYLFASIDLPRTTTVHSCLVNLQWMMYSTFIYILGPCLDC
jgi:hypothetical protein